MSPRQIRRSAPRPRAAARQAANAGRLAWMSENNASSTRFLHLARLPRLRTGCQEQQTTLAGAKRISASSFFGRMTARSRGGSRCDRCLQKKCRRQVPQVRRSSGIPRTTVLTVDEECGAVDVRLGVSVAAPFVGRYEQGKLAEGEFRCI